jgi:hypothetical protein
MEMGKRLNAKIYAEARRLGVKWILGGECGHMWRVVNQYMDTWNRPADFLEVPVSPITGTRFENARSTKMVHIAEFTADLLFHDKLSLTGRMIICGHFLITANNARGWDLENRAIL